MSASRERLLAQARRGVAHYRAGTQDLVDEVYEEPAASYVDPDRWALEMERVFRRLPLVIGAASELEEPGSYLAMDMLDTPVVAMRGDDGQLRAFVNTCSHRGAVVVSDGPGSARRHPCPYHGWTYNSRGELVGVPDAADVGELDRSCLGLTPLPCVERAGLVWVHLRPDPVIDIDTFLCGYGEMLEYLGLGDCRVVGRQPIDGPNWKVAYDGYLDFYHLPVLHRATFGPDMSTRAVYDWWGPHQRLTAPDRGYAGLADKAEEEWEDRELTGGVWTIFPHVSIAAFDAHGKVYMVSQLFPGPTPDRSRTIQLFLHTRGPEPGQEEAVAGRMAFNLHVVRDEDYATGLRIQQALRTGAKQVVVFGRNEGGGQRFHQFLDRLVDTDDADLPAMFKDAAGG